eukprot:9503175-Alexandrium_andersonii.AAC.1
MSGRSRSPRGHPSARSSAEPPKFDSDLGLYLVKQWAWGHKSACEVQREAHLALNDQLNLLKKIKASSDYASSSLTRLAAIGTDGKHEGSCKRDLV